MFTSFDALKGYHQCPLNEDSQDHRLEDINFVARHIVYAPYLSTTTDVWMKHSITSVDSVILLMMLLFTTMKALHTYNMQGNSYSDAVTEVFHSTEASLSLQRVKCRSLDLY